MVVRVNLRVHVPVSWLCLELGLAFRIRLRVRFRVI